MQICKGHWTNQPQPQQITQHHNCTPYLSKQLNSGRFLLEFSVTFMSRTDDMHGQTSLLISMIWWFLGHATYVACTYNTCYNTCTYNTRHYHNGKPTLQTIDTGEGDWKRKYHEVQSVFPRGRLSSTRRIDARLQPVSVRESSEGEGE